MKPYEISVLLNLQEAPLVGNYRFKDVIKMGNGSFPFFTLDTTIKRFTRVTSLLIKD